MMDVLALQVASALARKQAKLSGLEGTELAKHQHKLLIAAGKQRAQQYASPMAFAASWKLPVYSMSWLRYSPCKCIVPEHFLQVRVARQLHLLESPGRAGSSACSRAVRHSHADFASDHCGERHARTGTVRTTPLPTWAAPCSRAAAAM